MRLVPSLLWRLEGDAAEALDARLLPLLEAVAASASLAAAVAATGISYRAAWELLRDYQRKLGVALVRLERGRGASLTLAGERLLEAHKAALTRLAGILPGLATEIGPRPPKAQQAALPVLRVAASHDMALAALAETLPAAEALRLDLSFMGSLHALAAFAQGHADIAGFHVPIAGSAEEREPFLRPLRAARDRLIRFADRDQGLILPRGNPAKVRRLRDIAAKGQRFVNRQRGSGTRLLIDRMIAEEGLEALDLDGYQTEEFTHSAVAATVASGGADVGFGLRAAAAEYQLAFVPLVRERYFLAVRAQDLENAPLRRLLETLRGPAFGRIVRALPGNKAAAAGCVVHVEALGALRKAGAAKVR
jgi:molybdate transport repressor ModE-like protein